MDNSIFQPRTDQIPDQRRPFIWIDMEALDMLHGKSTTLSVYLHIVRRAGHDGRCWESVSSMAAFLGLSEKTVKASLRALLDLGMVSRESRAGQTSEYSITDPSHWIRVPDAQGGDRRSGGGVKITPGSEGGGVKITPGGGVKITPQTRSRELDPQIFAAAAASGDQKTELTTQGIPEVFGGQGKTGGSPQVSETASPACPESQQPTGIGGLDLVPAVVRNTTPEITRPAFPVGQPLDRFKILTGVPPRPGYEDYVEVAGYPDWCPPHCWFWYVRAINEEMARIGKAGQTPGALRNAFVEGKKHGFWKRWIGVYLEEQIPLDEWPVQSPFSPTAALLLMGMAS